MARKRKQIKKIVVDYTSVQEDLNKPVCFGGRQSYCRADLCGQDWFDSCPINDQLDKSIEYN